MSGLVGCDAVEAWAKDLVDRKAWVLNTYSNVIGQAKRYYNGLTERYISTVTKEPTRFAVLELESGHALMANPEKFVELSAAELRYFQALQEGFTGLIVVAAKNAKDNGVELDKGLTMLTVILRTQLAALEAT